MGAQFDWVQILMVADIYDLEVDDELIEGLQMLNRELPKPGL